jgi:hypothetical protein
VAGSCEYGDEPSGSEAAELDFKGLMKGRCIYLVLIWLTVNGVKTGIFYSRNEREKWQCTKPRIFSEKPI